MTDECDGIDNNCDGTIDEDAIGGIYEPNDTPVEWLLSRRLYCQGLYKCKVLLPHRVMSTSMSFSLRMAGLMTSVLI